MLRILFAAVLGFQRETEPIYTEPIQCISIYLLIYIYTYIHIICIYSFGYIIYIYIRQRYLFQGTGSASPNSTGQANKQEFK